MSGNEKFKDFADFLLHAQEGDVWETATCYRDHLGNKVYKEGYEWLADDVAESDEDMDDLEDFEDEDLDDDADSWLTDKLLEAGARTYVNREMERLGFQSKEDYLDNLISKSIKEEL